MIKNHTQFRGNISERMKLQHLLYRREERRKKENAFRMHQCLLLCICIIASDAEGKEDKGVKQRK